MSKKETLAMREGFIAGMQYGGYSRSQAETMAKSRFPLPKKAVPRTVDVTWRDGTSHRYRIVDNVLEAANVYGGAFTPALHTIGTIKALNGLIDNPTKLVEDECGGE